MLIVFYVISLISSNMLADGARREGEGLGEQFSTGPVDEGEGDRPGLHGCQPKRGLQVPLARQAIQPQAATLLASSRKLTLFPWYYSVLR